MPLYNLGCKTVKGSELHGHNNTIKTSQVIWKTKVNCSKLIVSLVNFKKLC